MPPPNGPPKQVVVVVVVVRRSCDMTGRWPGGGELSSEGCALGGTSFLALGSDAIGFLQ
jgi:hypothetical protein